MLFSLNKEDSNQNDVEQINDTPIENDNLKVGTEKKYALVNNSYSSNNSGNESTVTKKHITIDNNNLNEPR